MSGASAGEALHKASAVTGIEKFRTSLQIEGESIFQQVSDTPTAEGGKDLGPSPVALLTAALAACKTMTARSYASRKDWPLESIRVDVQHVRRAVDGKQRDVFECEIQIQGDLDDDQVKRIYEITNMCPVHKMLMGETLVESSLKAG